MKTLKSLMLISLGILCLVVSAQAQYVPGAFGLTDISLLFSNTNIGGSARMQAIGGAQISLGGDISAASANPAGLGFFRKSEFSFSPSYNIFNSESRYFNTISNENDTRLNFANVGIVFNNSKDDIVPGAWRGGSFAISINKVNDFNGNFYYEGVNDDNTIIDYFAGAADGILTDKMVPDLIGLSYFSYLINPTSILDPSGRDDVYFPITFDDQIAEQSEFIESTGGQYQWNFAYGGNFSDKIYLGANLGLSNIRYETEKQYSSFIDDDSQESEFAPGVDLTINENLRLTGIGINGTVGVIVKPIPFLNIGASFTTPTIINVDEETTPNVFVDYFEDEFDNYEFYYPLADSSEFIDQIDETGDLYLNEYRITSPFRASLGATAFFGKFGFVSADVDYINFSSQKFRSRDFSTEQEKQINRDLFEIYREVLNLRVGAELRYNIFRFRGGFAYNPSPYKDNTIDRSQTRITAGAGIRMPKFFLDLAYVNTQFTSAYSPYMVEPLPIAEFDNNFSTTTLTAGFYF
ncbi:MAG: OmpP1/FadL family transporter [Cyclobacteriaceae bacterium]